MRLPTVAIVGRPNVGKSSLFNRFLNKRLAVVHEEPGVTRDRNYAVCDWNGVQFELIDTGGMAPGSDDLMEQAITDQTDFAIAEADLVLFMVDTQVGVDTVDMMIARSLNRAEQKCILVANKADNQALELDIYEFYRLGLGDPMPVSATGGLGVGDLLDKLVEMLPDAAPVGEEDNNVIRVALAGRPNVGKSSFINQLIGEDRLIVTPIAGTTRDAVDTPFNYDGQSFVLVDTAGLRRKYKVYENVEFYTNLRTDRAIDNCDVAVVLIDAQDGMTVQDQRVLEKVLTSRRAAVLAVNKWDLIEKDSNTADEFTREIKDSLSKYSYLPIIYISALSGQRVPKVLSLVKEVYAESRRKIATPELNDFLQETIRKKHPPAQKGKYIKFNYVAQTEVAPPTFVFFVNHPTLVHKTYISFLANQLRQRYGFTGVPIRLKFRKK